MTFEEHIKQQVAIERRALEILEHQRLTAKAEREADRPLVTIRFRAPEMEAQLPPPWGLDPDWRPPRKKRPKKRAARRALQRVTAPVVEAPAQSLRRSQAPAQDLCPANEVFDFGEARPWRGRYHYPAYTDDGFSCIVSGGKVPCRTTAHR